MEREWRKYGNLEFNIADLAVSMSPTDTQRRLRVNFLKLAGKVAELGTPS